MSEIKHTPGPWSFWQPQLLASSNPNGAAFVTGPTRVLMDRSEGFSLADAKLIAAAPDLLEVAREALAVIDRIKPAGNGCGTQVRLSAAIAKATA